jgi:hypothetical protein
MTARPDLRSPPFRARCATCQLLFDTKPSRCAFIALLNSADEPAQEIRSTKVKKKAAVRRLSPPIVRVRHLILADCAENQKGKKPAWTDWQDYGGTEPVVKGTLAKLTFKSEGQEHSDEGVGHRLPHRGVRH